VVPARRLRLLYFLYYANVGTNLPYFAVYLRGLGFDGGAIGTVQMLPSLLSPLVALGWAGWADRHGAPTVALRRAALVAVAAALLLPLARTPLAVGAVLLAMALGDRALVPLLDANTLEWSRQRPAVSYARVRLFGSIGFSALALAGGAALAARGDRPGDVLVPVVIAGCFAAFAAGALALPPAPGHGEPRPAPRELLSLLRHRPLAVLLGACALHWTACAPYHLFFGVLVRDRGLPSAVAGLGMTAGVAAEILALLLFPRLERRLSTRTLLAIAFLGSALRWIVLSRVSSAGAIVSLQLLHGLTFGLFWGTAMHALGALVPPRLRATGQALFSAVVFGAGNAIGYRLSGAAYDWHGAAAPLFAWAAALEVVALAAGLALLGGPGAGRLGISAGPGGSSPRSAA
jgi:PPP family 3-phenylpropionic acid transporter